MPRLARQSPSQATTCGSVGSRASISRSGSPAAQPSREVDPIFDRDGPSSHESRASPQNPSWQRPSPEEFPRTKTDSEQDRSQASDSNSSAPGEYRGLFGALTVVDLGLAAKSTCTQPIDQQCGSKL